MGFKGDVQIWQWSNNWRVRDRSFTGIGFGCLWVKRKHSARHISSITNIISKISNGGCVRKSVLNHKFKFHDHRTVNEFGIIILVRQVWVYAGKERILGKEEEKTNLRGRESTKTCNKCKKVTYYVSIYN